MNVTELSSLMSVGNSIGIESNSKLDLSQGQSDFTQKFEESIESLEGSQVESQNTITELLRTGEGDSTQAIIEMNKATSEIKMAAVVRDKLIENYQTIMNIQI